MNALALILPCLPYMYMHTLAIWLLASQTVYSPTPAFSSCADRLQGIAKKRHPLPTTLPDYELIS